MAPRGSGRWDRGAPNRGNHSGGNGKSGSGICRNFQQTGHCKFGSRCRFSHDLHPDSASEGSSRRPRERPKDTPEQLHAKAEYSDWKRLIKSSPRQNDTATIKKLWTEALDILNDDDRDMKQMLPRDLDSEENHGREHIYTLMSMEAHVRGHGIFIRLVRPFLLVMSHTALVDCLSVDTAVGGIYNYMSGNNGSRAIPFFRRLGTAILDTPPDSAAVLEETLIAMSMVLRELLRREKRAIFNENLTRLVDTIENATAHVGISPLSAPVLRNILQELRGMVAHSNVVIQPQVVERDVSTRVVTSTYPQQIILPCDRHDNDKMDIAQISIFPTLAEVQSDHPPFLPSTDLDREHHLTDPLSRHLDTHFRLLRHDIFGHVSEALGRAMLAIQNDSKITESFNSVLGNIRAYSNPEARVTYLSFNQRRGLEAQISFTQPHEIRKKSPSQRSKWWLESKRFEDGVLLCLLSIQGSTPSMLFLTVSEKVVDANKKHSLSSHDYHATITTTLTSLNPSDVETLTRLNCEKARGILIEFPGILPPTFVPVLKNLQEMQRLSRLPFRQWILPDSRSATGDTLQHTSTGVPPPLYARIDGFNYSLKPILKNSSADFALNSRESVDNNAIIDRVVEQTELDRGQSQALIAALTREYAFIQGPPGTGKTYLGIKLMRVLLTCRVKANLGPVVVV